MCPKMVAFTAQKMGSNPLWPNPMWLKDPEDLHQNQLQHHQNHPQDHQNRLQGLQNLTNKQPPLGGAPYMQGSEAPEADPGGPGGGSAGPGGGLVG